MSFQAAILREEYARLGVAGPVPDPRLVERELAEYAEADRISIPSSFVRRTFLANGVPEAKLLQIPYGVDLSAFRPAANPPPVFRVVFCGMVSIRKGVHVLLEAFAGLAGGGAELWLVGPVEDEIRPFLARHAGAGVRVLGRQARSALPELYAQASVFCLPSLEEGLALTQVEAMASGLPVIGTTNSGAEDLVREGTDGWVLPIRDVALLRDRLEFCRRNPDVCREMGRSAAARAQAFGWEVYGDRIVEAYRGLLGGVAS